MGSSMCSVVDGGSAVSCDSGVSVRGDLTPFYTAILSPPKGMLFTAETVFNIIDVNRQISRWDRKILLCNSKNCMTLLYQILQRAMHCNKVDET